jgi:hypothetical protein
MPVKRTYDAPKPRQTAMTAATAHNAAAHA